MNALLKLWFCLVCACFIASPIHATIRCVGASATGSGDGSDWNNIAAFTGDEPRNSTNYLADGSYSGSHIETLESGSQYIAYVKATEVSHGVETGWSSALGDGVATFGGSIFVMVDRIIFDGVTGGGPGAWTTGHGIRVNGSVVVNPSFNTVHTDTDGFGSNCRFLHLMVHGNGDFTSTDDGFNQSYADNLYIGWCYTTNSDNCPMHFGLVSGITVEYSHFDYFAAVGDPNPHGEIMSGGAAACDDITIRWCRFAWVSSTGGLMFNNVGTAEVGMIVHGCVFYMRSGDTWAWGGDGVLGGWTARPDLKCENVQAYHNTFININTGSSGVFSALGTTPGNNRDARNNLFYDCDTGLPSASWDEDYNHYVDSGGESEANGTASTGDPFVTWAGDGATFATLSSNTTAGDSGLSATYRTDWFGNVGTTRGALQFTDGGTGAVKASAGGTRVTFGGTGVRIQ